MKALSHVILVSLFLSACVPPHVDQPHKPDDGDDMPVVTQPVLPPPGADGGWMIGSDGQPVFIGQPEPNPPVWER